MSLYGTKKSIILLMSIGIDRASEILKQLTVYEIKKIIKYMMYIIHMSSKERHAITLELQDFINPINAFHCFNINDICLMIKKAFGNDYAKIFLADIIKINDVYSMIQTFDTMKTNELFYLIKNEHIQIITIIIMNISCYQAAQVLECFSKSKRCEIMLRISTFTGLKQAGKIELANIVRNILKRYQQFLNNKKGIKIAAKILNVINITCEKSIMNNLSEHSTNLTKKILNEMLLFENIVNIEDKYIFWLVKNIKLDIICVALSNANDMLQKKFIHNMSRDDGSYLKNFFLKKTMLPKSKIDNAQKHILKKIKFIVDREILIGNNRKEKCLM